MAYKYWSHIRIDVNTKEKLVNISKENKIPISTLVNIMLTFYPQIEMLVNKEFERRKRC